jgi:hypothetical protein
MSPSACRKARLQIGLLRVADPRAARSGVTRGTEGSTLWNLTDRKS